MTGGPLTEMDKQHILDEIRRTPKEAAEKLSDCSKQSMWVHNW
jgi:hypothetical protein